jgi:hypothetical protein
MLDLDSRDELANDVIVGCRISSTDTYKEVYVSKVYIKQGRISIEFTSSGLILGVANGIISADNQTLKITGMQSFFSGYVIIGNRFAVNEADRSYHFDSSSGAIEDSCITVYPVPGVTKLIHNGKELTGSVELNLSNLDAVIGKDSIEFSVVSPLEIVSRGDFTAGLLTCKNPVIGSINTVQGHNIDIVGIKPVTVVVSGGKIEIGSEGVTVEEVCKPIVIPPVNNSDAYYTDIETALLKEWQTWPDYQI